MLCFICPHFSAILNDVICPYFSASECRVSEYSLSKVTELYKIHSSSVIVLPSVSFQ